MSVEYFTTDVKEIKVDKTSHFTMLRIIHTNLMEDLISFDNEEMEQIIKQLQK